MSSARREWSVVVFAVMASEALGMVWASYLSLNCMVVGPLMF